MLRALFLIVALLGSVPAYPAAQPKTRTISARIAHPYPVASSLESVDTRTTRPSTSCPAILELDVTEEQVATRFDSAQRVTQIFADDYHHDRIMQYDVDSALNSAATALSTGWGSAQVAFDLDKDGETELVVSRGDGYNGFLDILSAPDWRLRRRFAFPGMNGGVDATPVNMDSDPFTELYVVVSDFGFNGEIVVVKYAPATGRFEVISDMQAPWGTSGHSAIGDFDNDGRTEFITGNATGYGLFEWRDSVLVYIGQVGGPYPDFWNPCAVACRPKPGGVLHALVGISNDSIGFRFDLLQPTGDNTFKTVQVFEEKTGYSGGASCFAADVDCDGLDELVMNFFPLIKVWEWNDADSTWAVGCIWDKADYGNLWYWHAVDLDQNGAPEWGSVNPVNVFRSFPDPVCVGCDTTGHCVPPSPVCYCACHGDPHCDGIVSDVQDVVETVNLAFRNAPGQHDPGPLCQALQTDVDCSGATDIRDVVKIINVAFRSADPGTEFHNPCAP